MDEKPKKHHRAYLRRIDRRSLVLFPTTEHAQNQEPEIKKKRRKKREDATNLNHNQPYCSVHKQRVHKMERIKSTQLLPDLR